MFARSIRAASIATILIALAAVATFAQEFRGAITGRITDRSGSAIASAKVTITNTATNTASIATTNEVGDYSAPFLLPGLYTISVEANGFKRGTLPNIEVHVGDEIKLEVGTTTETVNISMDTPLLNTSSGTAGQVIDRRRISELPLSDGNPFTLTRLSRGIGYIGDLKFSRPFDNSGSSDFISNGV